MRHAPALLIAVAALGAFVAARPGAAAPVAVPKARASATPRPSANAPADRYFGRQKISALRVRYDIKQLDAALGRGERCPAETEQRALLTLEAFDDWKQAYPRDGWLPQTAYGFAKFEADIGTASALQTAHRLLEETAHDFGANKWAAMAKDDLHRGLPRPTPDPTGTPVPCGVASAAPSAAASAMPSSSPSTQPSAESGATPSAAPSPIPS